MPKSALKSVSEQGSITYYQSSQVSKDAKLNAHHSRYVLKPQYFTPTCHFCGKPGHIHPRCNFLRRNLNNKKHRSDFNVTASLQAELKEHLNMINRIAKLVSIPENQESKNKRTWIKKGS